MVFVVTYNWFEDKNVLKNKSLAIIHDLSFLDSPKTVTTIYTGMHHVLPPAVQTTAERNVSSVLSCVRTWGTFRIYCGEHTFSLSYIGA